MRDPGFKFWDKLKPHLDENCTDLTLHQCVADGAFQEAQALDLELEPGQRFTGVVLRYRPAGSHFDRSLKPVDGQSRVPVSFAARPL